MWPVTRVGLGKLLAPAKQPLPLGADALWGWGQQDTELGALSPHRLPGPPGHAGPDLPEAPACGFCFGF